MKLTGTCKRFLAKTAALAAAALMMIGTVSVSAQEQVSLPNGKTSYNLLLIGSDRRDDSWNGNSDVMMLATVNAETNQIILTSFMRDLYAEIPGHGVHKLNYAYAVSGADLLMETLEDNYRLDIDNYASVDFDTMAEIIDLIGGVEITVTDAESELMYSYATSIGETSGITGAGTYQLTGAEAVAYMRIRYVGNADYQRTQRQRDVLQAVFAAAKEMDKAELASLAEDVVEKLDHDVAPLQMLRLLALVPELTEFEMVENRIPYDDLYYSQNEMLVPNFEATIARLHETLGMAE